MFVTVVHTSHLCTRCLRVVSVHIRLLFVTFAWLQLCYRGVLHLCGASCVQLCVTVVVLQLCVTVVVWRWLCYSCVEVVRIPWQAATCLQGWIGVEPDVKQERCSSRNGNAKLK